MNLKHGNGMTSTTASGVMLRAAGWRRPPHLAERHWMGLIDGLGGGSSMARSDLTAEKVIDGKKPDTGLS